MSNTETRTVVTVLDNREDAEIKWPGAGRMLFWDALGGAYACCIGCHGLAYGESASSLSDMGLPHGDRHSADWVGHWHQQVPTEVREEVLVAVAEIFPGSLSEAFPYCSALVSQAVSASQIASSLNDQVAAVNPHAAVAGLRVLFRWMGDQVGEDWKIDFRTDRPVRVTTLDHRSEAEHYWPGQSYLVSDLTELTGRSKMCCLGCSGLSFGVPLEALQGSFYPREDHSWDFYEAWATIVPLKLMAEVNVEGVFNPWLDRGIQVKAMRIAELLNDGVASKMGKPEEAVEALRVLFKWVGDQVGEDWIIRFRRDDPLVT